MGFKRNVIVVVCFFDAYILFKVSYFHTKGRNKLHDHWLFLKKFLSYYMAAFVFDHSYAKKFFFEPLKETLILLLIKTYKSYFYVK